MIISISEDFFYGLGSIAIDFAPIFAFVPSESVFLDIDGKESDLIADTVKELSKFNVEDAKIREEIAKKTLYRTRFFYSHFGFSLKITKEDEKSLELDSLGLKNQEVFISQSIVWSFAGPNSLPEPSISYYLITSEEKVIDYINASSLNYVPKTHEKTLFDLGIFPQNYLNPKSFFNCCESFTYWANFAKSIFKINLENDKEYLAEFKEIEMLINNNSKKEELPDNNEGVKKKRSRGRPRKAKNDEKDS